jgi:hypothetical protein
MAVTHESPDDSISSLISRRLCLKNTFKWYSIVKVKNQKLQSFRLNELFKRKIAFSQFVLVLLGASYVQIMSLCNFKGKKTQDVLMLRRFTTLP